MAINNGVNISKIVAYAVLGAPAGVAVSKDVAYAVLGAPAGVAVSKDVAYAVLSPGLAPVWIGFFPNGLKGNAYSYTLTPQNGATSITLQSGSLPTGLALSGSSSATISGTPTALGTFTFTLRATNAYGYADQVFTIVISTPAGGGGSWTFAV